MKELSLIFPSSPFLIEQDVFPPLGILYLTSCLQSKGIKVHCYDMGIGHTPDMVKTEYVGISLLTAQKNEGLELIKYFKEQGKNWSEVDAKTVLGADYSSAQGYQQTRQQIKSLPKPQQGGSGCGA